MIPKKQNVIVHKILLIPTSHSIERFLEGTKNTYLWWLIGYMYTTDQ